MGEVSVFKVSVSPLNILSEAVALLLQAPNQREKSVTSLLWLLKVEKYTFIRVNQTIKEVCACLMHETIVAKLLDI